MKVTILLALLLALVSTTTAAERTWTGAGGNNLWSNPDNWSPVGVPRDGEDLNFFDICPFIIGCPAFTVVNDLNNLRVGQLKFGGSSGPVSYVVNGNPLFLTDWVLVGEAFHETQTANITLNCGLVLEPPTNSSLAARIQVSYGNDGENRLFLNGPIDLNGHDLTIILLRNLGNWRSRVDIAGTISGNGNIAIAPPGHLHRGVQRPGRQHI